MGGAWGWVMVAWMWDVSHAHAPLLSSGAGVGGWKRRGQGQLVCWLRPPNPTCEEGCMGVGHIHPHAHMPPSSHMGARAVWVHGGGGGAHPCALPPCHLGVLGEEEGLGCLSNFHA